jgi:hypothetical protein
VEVDPTAVEYVREVGEPPTAQVIDDTNAEPTGEQGIDGVTADEPRPARDDGDRLGQRTFSSFIRRTLKYSVSSSESGSRPSEKAWQRSSMASATE